MAELDNRQDRRVQGEPGEVIRSRVLFTGIVQGVGFRPFIYRCALAEDLSGFVLNRTDGVVAEVEGNADSIQRFFRRVHDDLPPAAHIASAERRSIAPAGDTFFEIRQSDSRGEKTAEIPPDMATCDDCLRELFDPADRRYRYPFINCTNCGPRLTIIDDIPYDRPNTSMKKFEFCSRCGNEYADPKDRRFHAEPNACGACGPWLSFLDESGAEIASGDPIADTVDAVRKGLVVAVKGLGGFHLCVDAANTEAVSRLRERKFREEKPFAIMVRDIEHARKFADPGPEETALLCSPARPIVLLDKKKDAPLSGLVAPGMKNIGMMLAYTPVHHLLLEENFDALVMTSANRTDEPIVTDNVDAITRLAGIADRFLVHNRDILVRCDDSIACVSAGRARITRRSRGYVPGAVRLGRSFPPVLALGPQMKSTVCVINGDKAFLSPHVGDLETPLARNFHAENISLMERIADCTPAITACDLHPGYYSSRLADKQENVIRVQHHHAHIASCMAENHLSGDVIGLALDGTGYGTDGNVWGGEILVANENDFKRHGHIRYFPLPGGEKAIREPSRIACALLREAYGGQWEEKAHALGVVPDGMSLKMLDKIIETRINTPITSSLGRLFDGVAALTGLRKKVSFEGQAAMELEAVATAGAASMPFMVNEIDGQTILDFTDTIRCVAEQRTRGVPAAEIAGAFHSTLCRAFVDAATIARRVSGLDRICLSGGCFQNRLLTEGLTRELDRAGFEVYTHENVPTNDGGISLGQAYVAAARSTRRTDTDEIR